MNIDQQCKVVMDETLRISRERSDMEAQAYFNQQTETWPTFAASALAAEIRKQRGMDTGLIPANPPVCGLCYGAGTETLIDERGAPTITCRRCGGSGRAYP